MPIHNLIQRRIKIAFLIHKIIEVNTLGQLFGPSGGGKTFLGIDWGLCVAAGIPWNGHSVRQGLVIYFCGEGHGGIGRRIRAWLKKHPGADVSNFYVSNTVVDFGGDITPIADEVARIAAETGQTPALLIIDTLARHLEGDENSSKDMGRFVAQIDALKASFDGCVALVIHHTGTDNEKMHRSRGSNVLRGAADFEFSCNKGQLTATKMKDADMPEPLDFKLEQVQIGVDEETGEDISSCYVIYGERSAKNQDASLASGERELLELVSNHPDILVGDLRAALYEKRKSRDPDVKYDTIKKAFTRSLDGLIDKKRVFMDGHSVKEGTGTFWGHSERVPWLG